MSRDATFVSTAAAPNARQRRIAHDLAALGAGILFGLGLAVAGMTNPRKVLAFLDVAGNWDPSLLLVLGGAVIVAATGFALLRRRNAPAFGDRFHGPDRKGIDASLVAGSLLFGVGWGLAGYCPGPAIASLGFGNPEALGFSVAMIAGAWIQRATARH